MPNLREINIKRLDIEVATREFLDHLCRLMVLIIDQALGRVATDGAPADRLVMEGVVRLLVIF